ncbi:hypothetical protein ADIWIN_0288 [Winogradskyella psychrotolerans RS-3]|uniref:Uncharacterized protein n=1 Tax=Winogradskyella psychrotolerans RS-3 TaxID=641526 RepID=S7XFD3_9FLAO|nr:hypothetical protein [Winogradskyella psychrotolerans]EPR74698.1 hypothetical protein ADIWIN_0288 [Winogradskyella psychrotolerans RS-3]
MLDNSLRFNEELKAAQEWEFLTRVLFYSPEYDVLEKPLIKIRRHAESISFNKNKNTRKWYYYLAREKLFLFLKNQKSNNAKEINAYLFSYFKNSIISYLFEQKANESWAIYNNTLKFFYNFPKSLIVRFYIKFVLLTGRGYNYRQKIIS